MSMRNTTLWGVGSEHKGPGVELTFPTYRNRLLGKLGHLARRVGNN